MRTAIPLATLLLAAAPARAEEPPAAIAPAAGYCAHARAVARSESATLVAPELFARVGTVSGGESLGVGSGTSPDLRVTAGLSYSLGQLRRGLGLRGRGDAECRRERARAQLQAALDRGQDLGLDGALAARARILDAALPAGEAIVEQLRGLLRGQEATLEELDAARLRLDELRALAARTAADRARLAAAPAPGGLPLVSLLREYRAADDEVERAAGGVRATQAWDVRLQGGYDQVVSRGGGAPLFAAVLLSYDLGHLWQRRADAEALAARQQSARDPGSLERRATALVAELRATLDGDRRRLRDLRTLEADLGTQLVTADTLKTSFVRRYRNHLWFERTRLELERAFLEERARALAQLVGADGA